MKTLLKRIGQGLMLVPALALAFSFATPSVLYAGNDGCVGDSGDIAGAGPGGGADCAKPASGATTLFGDKGVFITITNILLFIIGAIAVVMLIIGGIRYVVSSGDQNAVTSAKNTILYAIIGIIVAFLAYAAVNFVTAQLAPAATAQ